MLRPSPNHGTQRLPNDDDDDDTAKNRAPKFYAGLLQILCWEPGRLPSFKVSGDPWGLYFPVYCRCFCGGDSIFSLWLLSRFVTKLFNC